MQQQSQENLLNKTPTSMAEAKDSTEEQCLILVHFNLARKLCPEGRN